MDNNTFVREMAKKAMRVFNSIDGILPSVAIAQSILESGYGTSELTKYHNLHGLNNYHDGYLVPDAGSVFLSVPQYHDGKTTYNIEEMASFKNYEDSFESLRIWYTRPKYKQASKFKTPEGQITEIISKGYATGQGYVDSIIRLIAEWNLQFYDKIFAIQLGAFNSNKNANKMKSDAEAILAGKSRVRIWYTNNLYHVYVEMTHDVNRLTSDLLDTCRSISPNAYKKEVQL